MPESVEYNLYTRFTFKNQPGMSQMKATGGAFAGLYKNARLAQAGVRQVGTGLRQFGMFGMAAAGAVGYLVKKGIDFGKQWSNVRAVVKATPGEFAKMRNQAKFLGATTLFTATQAAEGMEHLGRASLTVGQIQNAIRPTLKLAVADNVELGRASQIVASAIKTFGINASKASDVADLFAYASRNSMTNVTGLGESLTYAGTAARLSGQDIYDTVGTLGLLAQIGLRGSIAGTAYKNALVKLAKGSKEAYKLFGGKKGFLNVMTLQNGEFRRFPEIIKLTINKLGKIKNKAERAAMAFKIFGIRGIAGFAALEGAAGTKDYAALIDNIRTASKGTAEQMAREKQKSLWGQFQLLKSAMTGVALEIYDVVQPAIVGFVGRASNAFQQTANALQMMNKGFSETQVAAKYGKNIAGIVFGLKEAIFEVGATIKKVAKTTVGFFAKISGKSKLSAKQVTKLVTKFVLFSAAIGPVILAVGALGMALGGMFNVAIGGFKVLRALTSKWGLVFMGITYLFSGGQKKGESFIVTMTRGLKNMIKLANKLLWPFKQIAKHLGTIPALMAGIVAYKGAKGLLARGGAMLAGSRNPLLRGLGKFTGAATGMPVYVTNWPAGGFGGGMPGMGGGLPGAAGAAGKMGFFGRMGAAARYGGMSLPGMMFGGKFVGTGAMGAGTGLGKAASLASGFGTAATALGAFTAAIAPAAAGLWELNKAYDPAHQAELRDKLMAWQRARDKKETQDEIRKGIRDKTGKLKGFTSLEDSRNETWEQFYAKKARKNVGMNITETDSALLRKSYMQLRKGQAWEGYGGMTKFGLEKIKTLGTKASDWDLKQLGLSREMLNVLTAIEKAGISQIDTLAKGWSTSVYIDGKEVAIATAKNRQQSNERAGKPPSPGARRRALERGT